MAHITADNVREGFTGAASTTITLGGAQPTCRAFSGVMANGDTFWGVARAGSEISVGIFTYNSSGGTVTQTTVFYSSNSNNAVSFSSGAAGEIFIDLPARASEHLNLNEITVASATTCDIGAATVQGARVLISGTTTITSFGTGALKLRYVRFAGVLTLTHNGTSLILPGGLDITTAAGAVAIFFSDASGNWRCISYVRADGHQLTTGQATIASATTTDLGSVLAQNVTLSGTTTITSFGSNAPTGALKSVLFLASLQITHNGTSMILPEAANIITAVGDTALFRHEGSGNWRCLSYMGKFPAPRLSPGGRLSLSSGVPVMTSTVSAATTVYYAPHLLDQVPLYDGVRFIPTTFTQLSQATADTTKSPAAVTTNSNYDMFVWNDSGTIRCTRGPLWSSGTARGSGAGTTELTAIQGIYVNANAITNGPAANRGTYVGTIRSNGSSQIDWILPTTYGTAAFLGVWNTYNRVDVAATAADGTGNWTYATGVFRQSNNASTARVSFVSGLAEDSPMVTYKQRVNTQNGTASFTAVGFALDSTSTPDDRALVRNVGTSGIDVVGFAQKGYAPQLGFHFVQGVEAGDGTNANTIYGQTDQSLVLKLRM